MANPHEYIGLENYILNYLNKTKKYEGTLKLICLDTINATSEWSEGNVLIGRLIQAIKGLTTEQSLTKYQLLLDSISRRVEIIQKTINYFDKSYFQLISDNNYHKF